TIGREFDPLTAHQPSRALAGQAGANSSWRSERRLPYPSRYLYGADGTSTRYRRVNLPRERGTNTSTVICLRSVQQGDNDENDDIRIGCIARVDEYVCLRTERHLDGGYRCERNSVDWNDIERHDDRHERDNPGGRRFRQHQCRRQHGGCEQRAQSFWQQLHQYVAERVHG